MFYGTQVLDLSLHNKDGNKKTKEKKNNFLSPYITEPPNVWHRPCSSTCAWFCSREARNKTSMISPRPWPESSLHSRDTSPVPAVSRGPSHPRRTQTPDTSFSCLPCLNYCVSLCFGEEFPDL